MPTSKSNLTQVPVNSDTFNLTGDLGTMAESITSIVSVANQAAGDTVATQRAAAGFAVTDARPLFCWDQSQNSIIVKNSSGWHGGIKPRAHMGRTAAFQTIGTTTATRIIMSAAQVLVGGFTFDSATSSLVVPLTGTYRVNIKGFFTGASTYLNQAGIWVNGAAAPGQFQGPSVQMNKMDGNDVFAHGMGFMDLTAGDKVSMWCATAVSTWGSSGWDGAYVEIEYMNQW